MNYKFKLSNLDINVPDCEAVIRVGELEVEVTDLNLLDSLKIAKEFPAMIRELRLAIEAPIGSMPPLTYAAHDATADDNTIDSTKAFDVLLHVTGWMSGDFTQLPNGVYRHKDNLFFEVKYGDEGKKLGGLRTHIATCDGYHVWMQMSSANEDDVAEELIGRWMKRQSSNDEDPEELPQDIAGAIALLSQTTVANVIRGADLGSYRATNRPGIMFYNRKVENGVHIFNVDGVDIYATLSSLHWSTKNEMTKLRDRARALGYETA